MTLTVIADAGTEEEQTYKQSVSKNSEFYIHLMPEYEQIFYTDSDCTEEFTGDLLALQEDTVFQTRGLSFQTNLPHSG